MALIIRMDPLSFWIGFVIGASLVVFFLLSREQIVKLFKAGQQGFKTVRQSLNTGIQQRLMADLYTYAQHQHIAAGLFPLRDILVPTKVMVDAYPTDTSGDFSHDEVSTRVIPYLPDWPEIAAAYHAPALLLADALQGDASLLLLGHPGSGKSVALASLAVSIANGDVSIGRLSEKFPIYIHASDLSSSPNDKDVLDPIIGALAFSYASPIVQPRLPNLIRTVFSDQNVLLLLDGTDEFDPVMLQPVRTYLETLQKAFPKIQIVATGSFENYGSLNQIGLIPTAIASWNDQEKQQFVTQWSSAWSKLEPIDPNATEQVSAQMQIISHWLASPDSDANPLELTLQSWSVLSGEISSPDLPKLIASHIARLTGILPNVVPGLETLALLMVSQQKLLLAQKDADSALRGKLERAAVQAQQPSVPNQAKIEKAARPVGMSVSSLLSDLLDCGLLTMHNKNQVQFTHPMFAGFLAGSALVKDNKADRITRQTPWVGKSLCLSFYSCFEDITPQVVSLQQDSSDLPTQSALFQSARWLKLSLKKAGWRSSVMRSLANLIYKENATTGLSFRAMAGLALSGDSTVSGLFRQLIKSDTPAVRQIGVLGLGLMRDAKSVNDISALTHDRSVNVGRAACLALARIGSKPAVDAVINLLLNASEELRRAAAEALANHPLEGLDILKEALAMDDLLVRRSAIFGLAKMNKPEVWKLLETTAVSDGQWVVRNLAVQALEQKRLPNPFVHKPLPTITDLPWLLIFAAHSGIGIVNEKDAMNLVINAVERGETKEKMEALRFLSWHGDQNAVRSIYNVYYGSTDVLRATAFDAIWHIQASGVELPSPQKYGLG